VSTKRNPKSIQVGLVADEPILVAGLVSIFDTQSEDGSTRLVPIAARLEELLSDTTIQFMVLEMNTSAGGLESLETIRRLRPDIRLIVIGPEGNDELVLNSIIAGARAYLDLAAAPQTVWTAINVVTAGSIWAPRRLLSKLIDRLLNGREASLTNENQSLTAREQQVLELILTARSNREIANQLGIEERTVKAHVGRLMRKAGVENRIELSMRALGRPMPAKPPRQGLEVHEEDDGRRC
jgi:DNA-binding NarL/FixJ family response regulator